LRTALLIGAVWVCTGASVYAKDAPIELSMDWGSAVATSKTTISVQVCPEPPLRRGHPLHTRLFESLRGLGAEYARLQPWHPYPKLSVAELHPPKDGRASWDFTLIDPIVEDFMAAAQGRPVIVTFGTVPAWMFNTGTADIIPENPDEIAWTYSTGPHFTDFESTVKLFAAYQARLAAWYLKGGFEDEYGQWHASGHKYENIAYWEVLNEPDVEHGLNPTQIVQLYDAVVSEVRKVAPQMKFMGPALADVFQSPGHLLHFVDPQNHAPGIVPDAVSYHFYFQPRSDETPATMQHTAFEQADKLLAATRAIEAIRTRFSPTTKIAINELGSILPFPLAPKLERPIPDSYWNLSGAVWAYLYGHLAMMGVDMIHASELIDYPGQVPSATLVNWETGQPNARYWVVKLLRENFAPGDTLIAPRSVEEFFGPVPGAQIYAQGFIDAKGARKILMVNLRDRPARLTVPGAKGGRIQKVDQTTATSPSAQLLATEELELPGLAVGVLTLLAH